VRQLAKLEHNMTTSKRVATIASKRLKNPATGKLEKTADGAALSQAGGTNKAKKTKKKS
jgi:ribosomal protein S17E